MHTLLSDIFKIFTSIIQPYYCIFCYRKISYKSKLPICENCRENKTWNLPPFCIGCGRSISGYPSAQNLCKECLLGKSPDFKSFYPFKYSGIIKEGLHKLKYQGNLTLVKFFSSYIFSFAQEYILPFYNIDYISYVPLHAAKYKEREFNQSYLLAKDLAHSTQIPLLKRLLVRKLYTRPQSQLSGKARQKNVQGAFRLNPKFKNIIKGSTLLLIDDIITTGSTVKECLKEIRRFKGDALILTVAGS